MDAEKSQATMETDRAMILDLIMDAGVNDFNTFVPRYPSSTPLPFLFAGLLIKTER